MEPYLGEIRLFGGTYAPAGWLKCDGSVIDIVDNEALYSLLGTTYGGDGQRTFGLPDLRGRVPLQRSPNYLMGKQGGAEQVTLTQQALGPHTHRANAKNANGSSADPKGRYWAGNSDYPLFGATAPDKQFAAAAIGAAGGNDPHDNMMPFLTLTFIIAASGIYPSA